MLRGEGGGSRKGKITSSCWEWGQNQYSSKMRWGTKAGRACPDPEDSAAGRGSGTRVALILNSKTGIRWWQECSRSGRKVQVPGSKAVSLFIVGQGVPFH